jgi:predicted ATPase
MAIPSSAAWRARRDRGAYHHARARRPQPARQGSDAVASARTAALLDPKGENLTQALADIESAGGPRVAPNSVAQHTRIVMRWFRANPPKLNRRHASA